MSDELQRSMGRVEAKVDLLLERTGSYDKRIGSLEKRVWYASGASAVVAFIATHIIGKQ
jgi:hypothetical protein